MERVKKYAIECQFCDKTPSIETCGKCREIVKFDLALMARGATPVYLSERNRCNTGRKPISYTKEQLKEVLAAYEEHGNIRAAAKTLGLSKDKFHRMLKQAHGGVDHDKNTEDCTTN